MSPAIKSFPVPPGVVATVVQRAADPETTLVELAAILETDVTLTAQVLKTVNTVSFGLRHPVTSVARAVGFLGIRGVRNLVLCFGVRNLVSGDKVGGFPIEQYWESSLRRAAAAQCLAEHLKLPGSDEYFTRGLCQDIGVLLLVTETPELGEELTTALHAPADRRRELETELSAPHDELAFDMFSAWQFPEALAVPIRYHHRPEEAPEAHRTATRVSWAAESIADLASVEEPERAAHEAFERIGVLGIEEEALQPMLERIDDLVAEFAEVLGIRVTDGPAAAEILLKATEGLAELNSSYDSMTRRLEQALQQNEQLNEQLREHNQQLACQALTDALTGLPNRRAFEATLARSIAMVRRQNAPITLLMLDIDHFKRFNDLHGHPAGDAVLRHVAGVLLPQLREADISARYGGEEFAVIMPFTDAPGGRIAAERIRRAIEATPLEHASELLRAEVSIGGTTFDAIPGNGADVAKRFVELADEALYAAKEAGRNRVCWSR